MTEPNHTPIAGRGLLLGVLLAVMGLLYLLLFILTPPQVDDLLFGWYYSTSDSFFDFVNLVRQEENGRLPNIICGLWINYIPDLLGDIILASLTVGFIAAMAYLPTSANGKHRLSPYTVAIVWGLIGVLLPWREGLFITDITFNYVPVGLLGCLVIALMLKGSLSTIEVILGTFAALVFGMMHEAASLLTLVGLGFYFIYLRGKFNRNQWVILIGLLVGSAILLSSAGIWLKLGASEPTPVTLKNIVKSIPATILLLAALSTIFIFSPLRCKFKIFLTTAQPKTRQLFVICLSAALAGVVLCWRTHFAYTRAGWFGEMFAIVCLTILFQAFASTRQLKFFGTLAAIGMTFAMVNANVIQFHNYKIHKEIESLAANSPSGTVFFDYTPHFSWLALKYPTSDTWLSETQIAICHIIGKDINVVPASLANYTEANATPLPPFPLPDGTSSPAHLFDGQIVIDSYPLTMYGGQGEEIPGVPAMQTTLDSSYATLPAGTPILFQRFTTPEGLTRILLRTL